MKQCAGLNDETWLAESLQSLEQAREQVSILEELNKDKVSGPWLVELDTTSSSRRTLLVDVDSFLIFVEQKEQIANLVGDWVIVRTLNSY